MNLCRFFALLYLTCFVTAGPLVALVGTIAGAVGGEAAAAGIAGSSIAAAVGVGASSIWYGGFVIVNGALYYGSTVAAAGAVAGAAAGGAAAGLAGQRVEDEKLSKSVMSSMSSESVASVASVASVSSVEHASKASEESKALSISKASVAASRKSNYGMKASLPALESQYATMSAGPKKSEASKIIAGLKTAVASISSLSAKASMVKASFEASKASEAAKSSSAPKPTQTSNASKPVNGPITRSQESPPKTTGPVANSPDPPSPGNLPPPPGQPVSILPPSNRPKEVPPGVPEYNFRMCQYDIIRMGQNKQNLTFDNPSGYDLRIGKIPPTCMVLATVMLGNPQLGPHPIPMGVDSLQWNNIQPDTMNALRNSFGLGPVKP